MSGPTMPNARIPGKTGDWMEGDRLEFAANRARSAQIGGIQAMSIGGLLDSLVATAGTSERQGDVVRITNTSRFGTITLRLDAASMSISLSKEGTLLRWEADEKGRLSLTEGHGRQGDHTPTSVLRSLLIARSEPVVSLRSSRGPSSY